MRVEVEIQSPINMIINVETYTGEKLRGKIIDWIPAGVIPSKVIMKKFYGEGWEHKPCKGAYRALKNDRVLFINEYNGHRIVQPLVARSSYCSIWLEK